MLAQSLDSWRINTNSFEFINKNIFIGTSRVVFNVLMARDLPTILREYFNVSSIKAAEVAMQKAKQKHNRNVFSTPPHPWICAEFLCTFKRFSCVFYRANKPRTSKKIFVKCSMSTNNCKLSLINYEWIQHRTIFARERRRGKRENHPRAIKGIIMTLCSFLASFLCMHSCANDISRVLFSIKND